MMSKCLHKIWTYLIWVLLAFLIAFVYMRIILGTSPEPSSDFMRVLDFIYEYAFLHVGAIIGAIISVLFILIDVFYLNKKLRNASHPVLIRFSMLLSISVVIGVIHYILEKVIDVI